jgi:hypothetical protein
MLEVHEIMFNIMKMRPTLAYMNPEPLKVIAKYIYNWPYFSTELFNKSKNTDTQGKSKRL